MIRRRLVILFLVSILSQAHGVERVDTREGIMAPSFRTLQVQYMADPFAPPVININSPGERITVSFDELADERRYLRYSLEHCDAAWQPGGLVDSEFLDGFNEGTVDDVDYSRATVVHYVHYSITIPNDEIRITRPGNYLLKVYDEREPEETLLQARFGVCDITVPVRASVSSRTDIDSNDAHQQLAVRVDTRHLALDDPFSDMRVVITQNGRPDNEAVLVTPSRVNGSEIVYEHLRPLIFPAGNEYRRFETSSVNFAGLGVDYIVHDAPVYNAVLTSDYPRAGVPYIYDSTRQGRYVVRSVDADDSATGADYVLTHFSLLMPPLAGYDIFLDGDFTSRRFDHLSRMVYNPATGAYEQSLLLKQGAYNYQYLAVPSGADRGETAPVEGDTYHTVNEYTVKVYYRPRGERSDRLVGVTTVTSGL